MYTGVRQQFPRFINYDIKASSNIFPECITYTPQCYKHTDTLNTIESL